MQNEYYFKSILRKKISEATEQMFTDNHDMGWIPENIEDGMTEAAWLILSQNKATNDWLEKEGHLK